VKVLSSSMFVAIFGDFRSHPWIVPDALTEDAYSFFVSRAELMGWSREGGCGLWDMNDASFSLSASSPRDRIAWFQVGLDETTVDGSAFPFHPLLTCGCEVLGRVGDSTVQGVQFLVPLQIGGAPATISSVPNWFKACDPATRVTMRATPDSGEDPVLPRVAADVAAVASEIAREPFTITPAAAGAAHVQLFPEVTDGFWLGEGRHGHQLRHGCT
jgi:hypothetical protein